MSDNHPYLNFDEYIRQGEPSQKEKALNWKTAIGLQAVDGLRVSDYLRETAQKHIEGEISSDDVKRRIREYYQTKTKREPDDDERQEADSVSSNIQEILATNTLDFSVRGYMALHRKIFDGVFKHAGQANYKSAVKGIDYSPVYLERFFRNLLLGEQWDLRNRYLHIHPSEERIVALQRNYKIK